MSYTVIPSLAGSIIKQVEDIGNGEYSIDETVRVYEVLKQIEELLELTVLRDRGVVEDRVECCKGVASPTVIKGDKPKTYINIWKGME
jgi:phenylalanine-4-hydroxylase